ncbi:MAG: hypoxanthine phosphoribosyltransferase [Chloroflexota bacterium]
MTGPIELADPLLTANQIQSRVRSLADDINGTFANSGRRLSVIVVLKGACFFAIDLLRHLTLDVQVDFLRASSYLGAGSTGEVRLLYDITMAIAGTDVLLVEDIVDTGLTATWLRRHLAGRSPASVHLVTLLDKPSGRRVDVNIDWSGFTIPDEFVVGYGLDYDEAFRNLPGVYVAREVQE